MSVAMIVAGYAAYVGWSWWVAALVGALSGIAYCIEHVRARHDFYVVKVAPQVLIVSIAILGAWTSATYFIIRWLRD